MCNDLCSVALLIWECQISSEGQPFSFAIIRQHSLRFDFFTAMDSISSASD